MGERRSIFQDDTTHRQALKEAAEGFSTLAEVRGVPCGIPLALVFYGNFESFRGSISLSTSYLKTLHEAFDVKALPDEVSVQKVMEREEDEWILYRQWSTSLPWRGEYGKVKVWKHRITGKFRKDFNPSSPWLERLDILSKTMANLLNFGIEEAELRARSRLNSLLSERQRRSLLLSDSFHELGKSGILYWIRKNRPTIAIKLEDDDSGKPICGLCFHPLGYFTGTFVGMLAPSDDMIAHLLMIRSNEHFYWKKSNQHRLGSQLSGT